MSGVTITGFVPLTLTDVKALLEAAVRSAFGASFDVSAESPMGQILGIIAERIAEDWDSQERLYAAMTRDGAVGQALDNIGALTGTPRAPAKFSTVVASLTGTPSATIPAGTVFAVTTTQVQFKSLVSVTLSGGGTGTVPCQAVLTGPKLAPAATLTVIVSPVSGLSTVTNSLDAVLGADIEPDSVYRRRQESELRAAGKAAVLAIRDSLLQVTGVTAAVVFENPTDTTDVDGLPPHSIECLASGGSDADIAETVFEEKAAGIATYGGTTASVTDVQGIVHTIKFSRPTDRNVYVVVDLIIDPTVWPVDGVAQVKAAVVAYGVSTLVTGKDVVASAVSVQTWQVSGVLDAPPAKIGLSPSPTLTTTIVNTLRQRGVLDTSRITVNVTNGTP